MWADSTQPTLPSDTLTGGFPPFYSPSMRKGPVVAALLLVSALDAGAASSHFHIGGTVRHVRETLTLETSRGNINIELSPRILIMRLGSPSDLAVGQDVVVIGTQTRRGFILKRIVRAERFRRVFLEGMGKWERMKCRWKAGTLTGIFPIRLKTGGRERDFLMDSSVRVFLPADKGDLRMGDAVTVTGKKTNEGALRAEFILAGPDSGATIPPGPHAPTP